MSKIKVKTGMPQSPDGGFKVFWDKDDQHEDGELLITDDKVHDVVVTAGVSAALASGLLKEVRGGKEVEYDAEEAEEAGKGKK